MATLVAAGLNQDEIVVALKIAPTAFRQRLTTIRRAWQTLPEVQRVGAEVEPTDSLDLGLMRRALLDHVKRLGGVGTHDPDGHLIVLADFPPPRSQTALRRQQKDGSSSKHRED